MAELGGDDQHAEHQHQDHQQPEAGDDLVDIADVGERGEADEEAREEPLAEQADADHHPGRAGREQLDPLAAQQVHPALSSSSSMTSRKRSSRVERCGASSWTAIPSARASSPIASAPSPRDEQRPLVALDLAAARRDRRGEPLEIGGANPRGHLAAGGELGQRRLRDQLAVADHDQLVGGLVDLGEDVAGDEHGAALGGLRSQQVAQPAHPLRVESVGRLVEDQDAGIAEQRRRQRQALAHAQRVALDATVGGAASARPSPAPRRPASAGCRPPPRAPAGGCARCGRGGRRSPPAPRRSCAAARAIAVGGSPLDQRLAAARPQQAEQRPHRRRLAGAVGAEEAGHAAGLDREGEVVDGHGLAVALGQISNLELGHRRHRICSGGAARSDGAGRRRRRRVRCRALTCTADSSSSLGEAADLLRPRPRSGRGRRRRRRSAPSRSAAPRT